MVNAEEIRVCVSLVLHWIEMVNSVRQSAIHHVEKEIVPHRILARVTVAMNWMPTEIAFQNVRTVANLANALRQKNVIVVPVSSWKVPFVSRFVQSMLSKMFVCFFPLKIVDWYSFWFDKSEDVSMVYAQRQINAHVAMDGRLTKVARDANRNVLSLVWMVIVFVLRIWLNQ